MTTNTPPDIEHSPLRPAIPNGTAAEVPVASGSKRDDTTRGQIANLCLLGILAALVVVMIDRESMGLAAAMAGLAVLLWLLSEATALRSKRIGRHPVRCA